MSKSADTLQLNCVCKYVKSLLHLLKESLQKMSLSDSLYTQSTELTDNSVNLVDGGIRLISLFPSHQVIARWLPQASGVSLLLGFAPVVGNMTDFVTKMTRHTRC